MIFSVDSGANLGWAIFSESGMEDCGLCRSMEALTNVGQLYMTGGVKRLVVERPHAGRTRARARDILTLAVRAGEAGGLLGYFLGVNPEYLEPQKWKGQLSKKRCNEIVEAKLSVRELQIVNKIKPLSAKHNVLDAIGIGLFSVGRWIIIK